MDLLKMISFAFRVDLIVEGDFKEFFKKMRSLFRLSNIQFS